VQRVIHAVEFARGQLGDKVAVWLLTISTAIVWVQGAQMLGLMRAADARMMAVPGSWSGAIIGGLLVGAAENIFLLLRGVTERDIYVMLLLFIFLTLRPGGLFGNAQTRD